MFRPHACRKCPLQLQQHRFRLVRNARSWPQSRRISGITEPEAQPPKRSDDPSLTPRNFAILKRARPRWHEEDLKKKIEKNLEATRSGKLVRYNEEWAQAWARDSIDREKEWSFLRNHLNAAHKINAWRQWRRNLSNLLGYWATGDPAAGKMPEIRKGHGKLLGRERMESDLVSWSSWDASKKKASWHRLMFSTLWYCPERALSVLKTTTQDTKLPGYAINDVVNLLSRWQKSLEEDQRVAHAASLCDFAVEHLDAGSDGLAFLRQNTVHNIIEDLDPERIRRLYNFLINRRNTMHEHTYIAIAGKLAESPLHRQTALEIAIHAMQHGGVDLEGKQWLSVCTAILHLKPDDIEKTEDFSAADAFGLLLEHGFRPNMVSYTALIRTLCVSGELNKAWSIFQIMRRREIEPDPVLGATLLDGAKRVFSAEIINLVAEDAAQHGTIDVVFVNDLLASILEFSEQERKDKRAKKQHMQSVPAFGPMLHYYARIFKLAPLQALIPLDLSAYTKVHAQEMPDDWQRARALLPGLEAATSAIPTKLDPTGATLSIMFIAFVKNLAQPIKLISLYAYYRQLIVNQHPVAVQFVREKGTFIYDVILKALLERPGMQRPALDIVSDMLRDTLEARESVEEATEPANNKFSHPPPSIHTWNILLAGFLFTREKELGNKIALMMRTRGVRPNQVTWNTLISGYAGLQDVKKTVQSLQGLESSGFEADTYTLQGFHRLVDKGRALLIMEKSIQMNEIKKAALNAAQLRAATERTAVLDGSGSLSEKEDTHRERSAGEQHQDPRKNIGLNVRPDEPVADREALEHELPFDEAVEERAPSWMKKKMSSRKFKVIYA